MSHTVPSATPIEAALLRCAIESEDPLYNLLFNQSPLGVGVVEWLGDDLRYLAVNPAAASRLGCAMSEARGRRGSELGVPADACAQLARLAEEALRRGGPAQLDWEVKTLQGLRSFRTTATPLPGASG